MMRVLTGKDRRRDRFIKEIYDIMVIHGISSVSLEHQPLVWLAEQFGLFCREALIVRVAALQT